MKKKEQQPDVQDTDVVLAEEMEPRGSPEEYGFPASPTAAQARTWKRQEMFLAAYSNCGAINVSAAAAGHSVEAYYYWVSTDHYMFQKRLELAKVKYLEKMEIEMDRRGLEGVDHPVIYKGEVTDTYKVYSDNLLMFRAKKLDPSYRDNFSVMEDVSAIRESLDALRSLGVPRIDATKVVEGASHVIPEESDTTV